MRDRLEIPRGIPRRKSLGIPRGFQIGSSRDFFAASKSEKLDVPFWFPRLKGRSPQGLDVKVNDMREAKPILASQEGPALQGLASPPWPTNIQISYEKKKSKVLIFVFCFEWDRFVPSMATICPPAENLPGAKSEPPGGFFWALSTEASRKAKNREKSRLLEA